MFARKRLKKESCPGKLSSLKLKCRGFTMREETKLIGSILPSFLDPNITYNILILIDEGFICQKLITSILVKLCRDSAAESLITLFFSRFSCLRVGFCNLTVFLE